MLVNSIGSFNFEQRGDALFMDTEESVGRLGGKCLM